MGPVIRLWPHFDSSTVDAGGRSLFFISLTSPSSSLGCACPANYRKYLRALNREECWNIWEGDFRGWMVTAVRSTFSFHINIGCSVSDKSASSRTILA